MGRLIKWVIIIAFFIGWINNAIKVYKSDWDAPFKDEGIRAVSIVIFPFGGVIGYMNFDWDSWNRDNPEQN
jgi:hypothetical protein